MLHRRHALAVRHLVAGERVGDHHPGHLPQARAQSAEELRRGHRVSARLEQNVEHVGVLVDRAPQGAQVGQERLNLGQLKALRQ